MNRRLRKKIWICSDVWMDILPSFDHAQLGLKMALLSDRFDILVDTHFDGKTTELTLWREITIRKDKGPAEPKLSEWIDCKLVEFPLPDRPLLNKICFKNLRINYIDHSVIAFLRLNKQIWDRMGTKLELSTANVQPIWDVLTSEIWPIFAPNIRHLIIYDGYHLDNLRRRISPTILTDLDHLNAIHSGLLLPDPICDDGPNATAGQALSKWLHTPRSDGQPKRLHCVHYFNESNFEWVNDFKETFPSATTSVSYIIQLYFCTTSKIPTEPFELVNKSTQEKLILWKKFECNWLLKRCPIIVAGIATTVQWENDENWDANLNNVKFNLWPDINESIGPLSGSEEKEEKEKADESSEN